MSRSGGYLSLLAKRQGLALVNTLFVVKTSSPWMWNRLYGLQPMGRLDDLARVHAEWRSVELADMVIGGSLHLLRWMLSQGYAIAPNTTFVQPNVATFDHLGPLQSRRGLQYGTRHLIDEIVFFGRLDARKGLLIFIQAINRLLRENRPLPQVITFLGKAGSSPTERSGESVLEFIKSKTAPGDLQDHLRRVRLRGHAGTGPGVRPAAADICLGRAGLRATVLSAIDLGAGAAFNLLASASRGDRLLFLWSARS